MARSRLKVQKPEDIDFFKGIIFGPHGAGKTTLLGSAQEDDRTYPMLFLAFEAGTRSLSGLDIDVVRCKTFADLDEPFDELSRGDHYNSVAIDSISEVQIEGMLDILTKGSRKEPDLFERSDWGLILVKMRRFVRKFKDLDMHVFFSALAKETVISRVGTVQVPLLQGSFAQELPGIVDTVAYLMEDQDEKGSWRTLMLHSNPKFSVKARAPWGDTSVPAELEDPTVSSLLDALGFEE